MRVIGAESLSDCARAIDSGEIVVVPTRRWYMLCADAGDADACERIFAAKERPRHKPLCLVWPSTAELSDSFVVNDAARKLVRALWPGDLALMLPWADPLDGELYPSVGASSALVTQDPGPLGRLTTMTRRPLATAVVSFSTGSAGPLPAPAISLGEVQNFLIASSLTSALVVDGGICPAANHLTVVDCSGGAPRTVRAGEVHQRAIDAALESALAE
nr:MULTISPECIES: Sua5/YciO/YrdC/YwlC family protein [Streptomyces]